MLLNSNSWGHERLQAGAFAIEMHEECFSEALG